MSNARFSIIPSIAVEDRRLTNAQFRTLAALGKYGDKEGWCFPKLKTLAQELGKSKPAVSRDIKALRELGYLEVYPQFREDGSQKQNLYRIRFDYPPSSAPAPAPNVNPPLTPDVNPPLTPDVNPLTPQENAPKESTTSPIGDDASPPLGKDDDAQISGNPPPLPEGQEPEEQPEEDSPPPPNPLEPQTPEEIFLFARLQANQRAKGRRGPYKFASLEERDKFRAAAERLGEDTYRAITDALERGICARARLIAYIAKWQPGRPAAGNDKPSNSSNYRYKTRPGEYIPPRYGEGADTLDDLRRRGPFIDLAAGQTPEGEPA